MRNLHRVHLARELERDNRFDTVEFRLAEPREDGIYRVIGSTKRQWAVDDPEYVATEARLEVGFKDTKQDTSEWYWFNWVEPAKSFVFGWHRDSDHPEHGPTHIRLNQGESVVVREPAEKIGGHPGAIFHEQLDQLPTMLNKVSWEGDQVTGFEGY